MTTILIESLVVEYLGIRMKMVDEVLIELTGPSMFGDLGSSFLLLYTLKLPYNPTLTELAERLIKDIPKIDIITSPYSFILSSTLTCLWFHGINHTIA